MITIKAKQKRFSVFL